MLGVAVAAGAILIGSALADSGRPGETVTLEGIWRDADGISRMPTSARAFVFANGTPIDSTATLVSGITWYRYLLKWRYKIPAAASDTVRYSFWIRGSDATITDDWFACRPSTMTLRPSPLDSIAGSAVSDLWAQVASSRQAVIDSTACTPCGAYDMLGNPVSDARVYLTRTASMLDIRTQVMSDVGNYYIIAPLDPVNPDTFYVSIWRQGSRQSGYTMVTRP